MRNGLPLIAAWTTILPYHDMTRWILSRCHVKGVVLKGDGTNLVSFAPENFTAIYRLPPPKESVDEAYMKAFAGRHPNFDECIQEWWFDDDAFKPSPLRVYRVQNFHEDFRPVVVMLCRLMGEKNCNLFRREWVPYMYAVVEHGWILNWANILADVMQKVLRRYLEASEGSKPSFFMYAYLLDMVCTMIEFPELKLKWGVNPTPIYELFSMLWSGNYIPHLYTICDRIMPRVYLTLFNEVPPRISQEAAATIRLFGHWYL